jgi:hypothetical protein
VKLFHIIIDKKIKFLHDFLKKIKFLREVFICSPLCPCGELLFLSAVSGVPAPLPVGV